MPREKKYTARSLETAAKRYFASISTEEQATKPVNTGRMDKYGHQVVEDRPVTNRLGEPLMTVRFFVPPTVGGLCQALKISRTTWMHYRDSTEAEMQDVTEWIMGVLLTWNEQELLRREGKDVRGIEFNLQNNFGYSEKRQVEVGEKTRAAITAANIPLSERMGLLRELAEEAANVGPDAETD